MTKTFEILASENIKLHKMSSIKQRQLNHLNSQVAQLQANISDLNDLLMTTSNQYEAIEKLGVLNGSLLMSANQVFEREHFAEDK